MRSWPPSSTGAGDLTSRVLQRQARGAVVCSAGGCAEDSRRAGHRPPLAPQMAAGRPGRASGSVRAARGVGVPFRQGSHARGDSHLAEPVSRGMGARRLWDVRPRATGYRPADRARRAAPCDLVLRDTRRGRDRLAPAPGFLGTRICHRGGHGEPAGGLCRARPRAHRRRRGARQCRVLAAGRTARHALGARGRGAPAQKDPRDLRGRTRPVRSTDRLRTRGRQPERPLKIRGRSSAARSEPGSASPSRGLRGQDPARRARASTRVPRPWPPGA